MICKRCQRSLRGSEGLKCAACESKFHLRCVSEYCPDRDSGDRGYQWKCALCQNYASNPDGPQPGRDNVSLLQAIHSISEKFELVNKIQLPKINTDLMQIKTAADRIARQNDDILRKIDAIEGREKLHQSSATYRKRNVCFSHNRSDQTAQNGLEMPTSFAEKVVRCRTRRRSYLWQRIFTLLNKKVNRRNSPRKTKL